VNEPARQDDLAIFDVPETSIIYRVFQGMPPGEAIETLSTWETSKGFTLPDRLIEIQAQRAWESVDALITPKKRERSVW
jgi:hypothetical protein